MDMSRPRPCSIQRNGEFGETVILGETRPLKTAADGVSSYVDIPVELRGITPLQVKAILKNATRRCTEEGWTDWKGNKVDPKKIDLYIINENVIKPFTALSSHNPPKNNQRWRGCTLVDG